MRRCACLERGLACVQGRSPRSRHSVSNSVGTPSPSYKAKLEHVVDCGSLSSTTAVHALATFTCPPTQALLVHDDGATDEHAQIVLLNNEGETERKQHRPEEERRLLLCEASDVGCGDVVQRHQLVVVAMLLFAAAAVVRLLVRRFAHEQATLQPQHIFFLLPLVISHQLFGVGHATAWNGCSSQIGGRVRNVCTPSGRYSRNSYGGGLYGQVQSQSFNGSFAPAAAVGAGVRVDLDGMDADPY